MDGLRDRILESRRGKVRLLKPGALTNQERVGKAMELPRTGIAPFVEREVQAAGSPSDEDGIIRMCP